MIQFLTWVYRLVWAFAIAGTLAACGGGTSSDPTSAAAKAIPTEAVTASAAGIKTRQSVAANGNEAPTQLVVRAHSIMAGDVGALMQVMVNGTLVETVEVRAASPTDYTFTVPALQPGSKIDVVFTNDATVNGVSRDLYVTHLVSGRTLVLPGGAGVSYDRGSGAAALDGIDVISGREAMGWNGALRLTWPAPNLTEQITVRASSSQLDGKGSQMTLRVDGVAVGTVEVRSTVPEDYVFAVPAFTAGSRIDVAHTNHAAANSLSRNLTVHYLRAGNTVLLPTAAGNSLDLGDGLAAFDGLNLQAPQATLTANGALRGKWPAPNMTDTLTVRASGRPAGGVAPVMQVLVDGVLLGSVNVTSTSPADFNFPTLPMQPGSQVQVLFSNPGTSGTETRSLNLAYAMAGKTVLLATAGSISAPWPAPNLTDTLTVRAKGTLAGNIGPIMQVLVDGVLLGAAEVRGTDFTDFSFPAPPMAPGRKVDVVYTNDATVNGVDRNLFLAYLIAGNTFLLPNSPGVTYDRGAGPAAFDGTDVIVGSATLAWNGAMRATWPQPNITSTVTVRASATVAGNVGAIMLLWVDGIAVSSVEVRATTPTDYTLPTPPLKPGSRIAVTFDNPATVDGVQRQFNLAYLLAGTTVLKPTTSGAVYNAGNLQAAWPSANLTDTLTVRAHGIVAGDIGPIMQVLVDGVLVGAQEVRASVPTDYRFAVPALNAGAKVDVAFINDGAVGGVNRDLHVHQLTAGKTYLLPTSSGVVIDRGAGAAAFDGMDVSPGGSLLGPNSALRGTWPAPNLTEQITVRASSSQLDGKGSQMTLRVDGVAVGTVEVRSTVPEDYVFAVPAFTAGSRIDVAHTNHAAANSLSRNLTVHYLRAGNTVLLPTAAGNSLDLGDGLAAFDGLNLQAPQATLTANGALRGKWPAPNMTDTLTVRASGRPAGGVAPVMQVLVDGVLLGSVNVTSTSPADFNFPTLPMQPGSQVQVLFSNPGTSGTETRSLNLAYAMAGKTVLLATAGSISAPWPAPNLTDTLTVRAKGTLAGNIGPIMQVLVDGVLLGTAEVRGTDFTDFSFPAPPMAPGRKVDVVYTNDATVNGVDRNLFLAYLIAGNTFLLPNSPGVTYDRGAGPAAFDGTDVIVGSATLAWNGAMRATWPQPNITSTVTVRASATVAGNVGAIMLLWVDGIAVSSVEVRATTPTDYTLPTPPLKPGSRIDLAYTNDDIVNGVDRNLSVHYLLAGSTYLLPTMAGVQYDLGSGNAALDGLDILPGQSALGLAGALRASWPAANLTDTLIVRASATLAGNVGALMQLRVDGVVLSSVEVRSTTGAEYAFTAPRLSAGSRIDLVFLNDTATNGEDRNLFVQYIKAQGTTIAAVGGNAQADLGIGEAAFDGVAASASTGALTSNGALRFVMPTPKPANPDLNAEYAASRLLQMAGFGPTVAEISRLKGMQPLSWLNEQMSRPATPDFVAAVQSKFDQGDAWRPGGSQYTPSWVSQRFWQAAANAPDVLRKRVAFALHQILMVSQADTGLYKHARAYAAYLDGLNRLAFSNYRDILEEVALSPVMGIYLSHMRNRPEDINSGRMPDENFGREVMQLFSIGLHELNIDGTPRLNSQGVPIETYTNDDVMAMAKVFTGWSWALADNELTLANFRWGGPNLSAAADNRADLLKMKPYPGQHSMAEKRLFAGKQNMLVIPAGTGATESVRLALDALFQHPNVGPFISRQLIQHLVSSHPSNGYVARVASVFNNNGSGVRGDMAAVVRAILLDAEATNPPVGSIGKLREPVMRVAHWMRSFGATSSSGQFLMAGELETQGQRAFFAPSVFGYFRPGFVPPNTAFSANRITVPEFQIVNESSTAHWVNTAFAMAGYGLGWTGSDSDVRANLQPLVDFSVAGDIDGLIERLNLLLYAGTMSGALKQDLVVSITGIPGNDIASHLNRARIGLFLSLASPEYLVQR